MAESSVTSDTPTDIPALRALAKEAPPLPWLYRGKGDCFHTRPEQGSGYSYGEPVFMFLSPGGREEVLPEPVVSLVEAVFLTLPALLDELERLRAEVVRAALELHVAQMELACVQAPNAEALDIFERALVESRAKLAALLGEVPR